MFRISSNWRTGKYLGSGCCCQINLPQVDVPSSVLRNQWVNIKDQLYSRVMRTTLMSRYLDKLTFSSQDRSSSLPLAALSRLAYCSIIEPFPFLHLNVLPLGN
jgi:hypothetical protein